MNTDKSVEEWLKHIPNYTLYKRIMDIMENEQPELASTDKYRIAGSLAEALSHAFKWDLTKEGGDYWYKIYIHYYSTLKDYPNEGIYENHKALRITQIPDFIHL